MRIFAILIIIAISSIVEADYCEWRSTCKSTSLITGAKGLYISYTIDIPDVPNWKCSVLGMKISGDEGDDCEWGRHDLYRDDDHQSFKIIWDNHDDYPTIYCTGSEGERLSDDGIIWSVERGEISEETCIKSHKIRKSSKPLLSVKAEQA